MLIVPTCAPPATTPSSPTRKPPPSSTRTARSSGCACRASTDAPPSLLPPAAPVVKVERRYWPDTLVLQTDFTTPSGSVRLVDFMPPRTGHPHVVRMAEC